MTRSLYGARTAICRGEKIFISRIVAFLPKHGREKVRKHYFTLFFLRIHSRNSREGCIIIVKTRQDIGVNGWQE